MIEAVIRVGLLATGSVRVRGLERCVFNTAGRGGTFFSSPVNDRLLLVLLV